MKYKTNTSKVTTLYGRSIRSTKMTFTTHDRCFTTVDIYEDQLILAIEVLQDMLKGDTK